MKRRALLQHTLLGLAAAPLATAGSQLRDPFTLGVASGDPTDRSLVLWTRLAPDPDRSDGGMPPVPVSLAWILARDPGLSSVVRQGRIELLPASAHAAHVEIDNLEPGQTYWYGFRTGEHASPIGRTRTLPSGDARSSLRFATASCQNYTHGYFVAYDAIVQDQPDFVVHLGDYIYDTAFGATFRRHESASAPVTLADFRRRHARYKQDPHLQRAHAAVPFFVTPDNHDATADNRPEDAERRRAAWQAWYEHMPVRGRRADTAGPVFHRAIDLGALAQISLLDARQYRDPQPTSPSASPSASPSGDAPAYGFGTYQVLGPELFRDDRSMLGAAQEAWLARRLAGNRAAWNVLASPGPFLPFTFFRGGRPHRYVGSWDAYPANRGRVLTAFAAANAGHPLVLSGDVHSFRAIDGALATPPDLTHALVEFLTSSISADWPEPLAQPVTDNAPRNPQQRFYDPLRRGYLLHDVSASEWLVTARAMVDVQDPRSAVTRLAQFRVRHGQPGFDRLA